MFAARGLSRLPPLVRARASRTLHSSATARQTDVVVASNVTTPAATAEAGNAAAEGAKTVRSEWYYIGRGGLIAAVICVPWLVLTTLRDDGEARTWLDDNYPALLAQLRGVYAAIPREASAVYLRAERLSGTLPVTVTTAAGQQVRMQLPATASVAEVRHSVPDAVAVRTGDGEEGEGEARRAYPLLSRHFSSTRSLAASNGPDGVRHNHGYDYAAVARSESVAELRQWVAEAQQAAAAAAASAAATAAAPGATALSKAAAAATAQEAAAAAAHLERQLSGAESRRGGSASWYWQPRAEDHALAVAAAADADGKAAHGSNNGSGWWSRLFGGSGDSSSASTSATAGLTGSALWDRAVEAEEDPALFAAGPPAHRLVPNNTEHEVWKQRLALWQAQLAAKEGAASAAAAATEAAAAAAAASAHPSQQQAALAALMSGPPALASVVIQTEKAGIATAVPAAAAAASAAAATARSHVAVDAPGAVAATSSATG